MADHKLRFTIEASAWDVAERYAANKIRTYTREKKRGADAVPDEQVLRDAVFTATPLEGSPSLWSIEVEVTV